MDRLNPCVPSHKIDLERTPIEVDEATRQMLAAAIAVVHVGIQMATMQIIACFYKERQRNFDPKEPSKRRRFIVSIGLVLPIGAIWHASISISCHRLGFIVLSGSLLPGFTTLIRKLDQYPLVVEVQQCRTRSTFSQNLRLRCNSQLGTSLLD